MHMHILVGGYQRHASSWCIHLEWADNIATSEANHERANRRGMFILLLKPLYSYHFYFTIIPHL